ncbi:Cytosolic 5'-nucleotidase 3, partial [Operophtera brumata]
LTNELQKLQEIPALRKNGTHIRNGEDLLRKINKIIVEGYNRLQIVTDFDNTLTADDGVDGKPVLNSFEMFRKCPSIPQSYKDEDYQLFIRYKPIENDPHMSIEEKSQHLVEWYRAAHNLMKGLKFPRQELKDIARNVTGSFRDGIHELISWINNRKVPILVLSSGLGEAVVDTLEEANLSSPQMKVLSNFLEVDAEDIIIGMKGNPIHSLNKNEASIKGTEYYEKIKERSNVILMGDTIGDANMVDGMDNYDTVIKIGYLSTKRLTLLPEYLCNFDIVSQNDQTMDVIRDLVNLL